MIVWCQLWSQRMRLGTIEDIGDSLALVRSKGGDVNKRLHLLTPCSRYHGPSVGVTHKNDRRRNSLRQPGSNGCSSRVAAASDRRCSTNPRRRPKSKHAGHMTSEAGT